EYGYSTKKKSEHHSCDVTSCFHMGAHFTCGCAHRQSLTPSRRRSHIVTAGNFSPQTRRGSRKCVTRLCDPSSVYWPCWPLRPSQWRKEINSPERTACIEETG